ncbi:MAG: DUF1905 domain-containing protein [Planctomycetes bacterium]|nr:DUF1905 domain-containing protein [Planctomycetota bacterium]
MPTFRCELVHGAKTPYDTWTFVIVPDDVRRALGGNARIPVRGTVAGAPIRATISKGEGVHRFAVTRDVQDAAGVRVGDEVEIVIEVDTATRSVPVPSELREVLDAEGLWPAFEKLAPSHRRAWSEHVAEAKKPETRSRRASKAPDAIRARLFPGQR